MASTGHFDAAQLSKLDALLTRLEQQELHRRRLDAERMAVLAELVEVASGGEPGADHELEQRSLRAEIAATLHESEYSVGAELTVAWTATRQYPDTVAELRAGALSTRHVRVIAEAGAHLATGQPSADAPRRAAYEAEVLQSARVETPARLRPIARRLAAEQTAATLVERHRAAFSRRHVRVVDCDDGMADLIAHLAAEDAYAIRDRIDRMARETGSERASTGTTENPESTVTAENAENADSDRADRAAGTGLHRDEARADVLRQLLLHDAPCAGHGSSSGSGCDHSPVRGRVQLVVPGSIIAGVPGVTDYTNDTDDHTADTADTDDTEDTDDTASIPDAGGTTRAAGSGGSGGSIETEPVAELIGYGPIDRETARRIAGETPVWERLAVSAAGDVLAVDRYRPSLQMQRLLRARDLHCRAPGCRTPAIRCDIDHTVAAAESGPTATTNLAHLCRRHHVMKHHSDWSVRQQGRGTLVWRSPTGREYREAAPSRVRFRQVAQAAAQAQGQTQEPMQAQGDERAQAQAQGQTTTPRVKLPPSATVADTAQPF